MISFEPSTRGPLVAACLLGAFLLTSCSHEHPPGEAHAHDSDHADDHGHDHGDGPAPWQVTRWSAASLLFVEFEPLVRGQPARFLVHLTDRTNGSAVSDATVRVAIGTSDALVANAALRPGIYPVEGTPTIAGQSAITFTVERSTGVERFEAGTFTVAPDATSAVGPTEADDSTSVAFLLEQQWPIGLRTTQVERRRLEAKLPVAGRVRAKHGSEAFVTPPVAGSLVAVPGKPLKHLGDTVERGEVLAYIRPPAPLAARAQLAADRAALRQTGVELDVRAAEWRLRRVEARAKRDQVAVTLGLAEKALARVATLKPQGLATDAEHEAAVGSVAAAHAEAAHLDAVISGLDDALGQLEATRAELDTARHERDADDLVPLISPITGEVVDAECIEGEQFEPGRTVFQVLDSSAVWIEARVPEFDLTSLAVAPSARVVLPGPKRAEFDVRAVGGFAVQVGAIVDPQTHTAPIVFELKNPEGTLKVGMAVDVLLGTDEVEHAIAVPRGALVKEGERAIVYVQVGGERFEKRVIETGITDGVDVEVRSGLAQGEHVVTHGARAVHAASFQPDAMGHGHVH
ncbi:MAG: efflux RND transporter periplasmic adaptor subunit [Planctomycetes bacterium]|nr:efflux RND transporter periplasmic adaptor subunit [Planctomycetota bacterium]MCC7171703.1 efflux RND transporter periplasmic adaptor subunit [Planctomycetota bacterium]